MDIHSVSAAGKYVAARTATQAQAISPTDAFANVAGSFAETLKTSEALAKSTMTGDADPHALVQALAQTELAVETAVTVRNRVVEAYQEILRMPV